MAFDVALMRFRNVDYCFCVIWMDIVIVIVFGYSIKNPSVCLDKSAEIVKANTFTSFLVYFVKKFLPSGFGGHWNNYMIPQVVSKFNRTKVLFLCASCNDYHQPARLRICRTFLVW